MGMLRVETSGSFKPAQSKTFKAQTSGHAVAVQDALAFLESVVLPAAMEQDRKLRDEGHAPDDGFKEAVRRNILSKAE